MDTETALNRNRRQGELEDLREAFIKFRNRKNREDQDRDRLLDEIKAVIGPFLEQRMIELKTMETLTNRLAEVIEDESHR